MTVYATIYSSTRPYGWYYDALNSKAIKDTDERNESIVRMDGVVPERKDVEPRLRRDFPDEYDFQIVRQDLREIEGELLGERRKDREGKARLTGWQSNDTMLACVYCAGPIRWQPGQPGSFGGVWGQVYHTYAQCAECGADYTQTSLPDYTRAGTNERLEPTWSVKKGQEEEYAYIPKDYGKAQMWREILAGTR